MVTRRTLFEFFFFFIPFGPTPNVEKDGVGYTKIIPINNFVTVSCWVQDINHMCPQFLLIYLNIHIATLMLNFLSIQMLFYVLCSQIHVGDIS